MIIETENHRSHLQLGMLATGAAAMSTSLLLPPTWGLFVNCALAGLQAWLAAELVKTLLTLRRINNPNKSRWPNTNAWLSGKEDQ